MEVSDMAGNKIYTFMASSDLWSKKNRVTRMEDIEKAPFYDELLFEIKSRADIESLIVAKEQKYKSDDLKINMKNQEINNEINFKKIERLEAKLNTTQILEKHMIFLQNIVFDVFKNYSQKKKENLVAFLSGYAQNGMFSMFYLPRIMTEKKSFFNLFKDEKIKVANVKLKELMEFCKQHDIYDKINLDITGKTKKFFEDIMSGKKVDIITYSTQMEVLKATISNDIEAIKNDMKKAEHSVKLANEGFERDNYVLIDLENSIIREYAKNMTAKLFPEEIKPAPKLEPKTQEPVAVSKEKIKQKEAKTSKITDMLGKVKAPDWNGLKEKTLDKFKTIKNPFKK